MTLISHSTPLPIHLNWQEIRAQRVHQGAAALLSSDLWHLVPNEVVNLRASIGARQGLIL